MSRSIIKRAYDTALCYYLLPQKGQDFCKEPDKVRIFHKECIINHQERKETAKVKNKYVLFKMWQQCEAIDEY